MPKSGVEGFWYLGACLGAELSVCDSFFGGSG